MRRTSARTTRRKPADLSDNDGCDQVPSGQETPSRRLKVVVESVSSPLSSVPDEDQTSKQPSSSRTKKNPSQHHAIQSTASAEASTSSIHIRRNQADDDPRSQTVPKHSKPPTVKNRTHAAKGKQLAPKETGRATVLTSSKSKQRQCTHKVEEASSLKGVQAERTGTNDQPPEIDSTSNKRRDSPSARGHASDGLQKPEKIRKLAQEPPSGNLDAVNPQSARAQEIMALEFESRRAQASIDTVQQPDSKVQGVPYLFSPVNSPSSVEDDPPPNMMHFEPDDLMGELDNEITLTLKRWPCWKGTPAPLRPLTAPEAPSAEEPPDLVAQHMLNAFVVAILREVEQYFLQEARRQREETVGLPVIQVMHILQDSMLSSRETPGKNRGPQEDVPQDPFLLEIWKDPSEINYKPFAIRKIRIDDRENREVHKAQQEIPPDLLLEKLVRAGLIRRADLTVPSKVEVRMLPALRPTQSLPLVVPSAVSLLSNVPKSTSSVSSRTDNKLVSSCQTSTDEVGRNYWDPDGTAESDSIPDPFGVICVALLGQMRRTLKSLGVARVLSVSGAGGNQPRIVSTYSDTTVLSESHIIDPAEDLYDPAMTRSDLCLSECSTDDALFQEILLIVQTRPSRGINGALSISSGPASPNPELSCNLEASQILQGEHVSPSKSSCNGVLALADSGSSWLRATHQVSSNDDSSRVILEEPTFAAKSNISGNHPTSSPTLPIDAASMTFQLSCNHESTHEINTISHPGHLPASERDLVPLNRELRLYKSSWHNDGRIEGIGSTITFTEKNASFKRKRRHSDPTDSSLHEETHKKRQKAQQYRAKSEPA